MIDVKRFCEFRWRLDELPHYEITFHDANNLASHKVGSYNRLHWLSQFGNLRMSPPPSSFGGLNPNRSFGFFFGCCDQRSPPRMVALGRGGRRSAKAGPEAENVTFGALLKRPRTPGAANFDVCREFPL